MPKIPERYFSRRGDYPGKSFYCPPCPEMDKRQTYQLAKRYGINFAQYKEIYEKQNGGCAICGSLETSKMYGRPPMLVVDHGGTHSAIRGLLCRQCNVKLHVVEDEQFLLAANKYLKDHDATYTSIVFPKKTEKESGVRTEPDSV